MSHALPNIFVVSNYYAEKLSAERRRACYDLAPAQDQGLLEAAIEFVVQKASFCMVTLELGCGYARVLRRLLHKVRTLVGIDTSTPRLRMAVDFEGHEKPLRLAAMDATRMGFQDHTFDLTICIPNGISAFGVDQQ